MRNNAKPLVATRTPLWCHAGITPVPIPLGAGLLPAACTSHPRFSVLIWMRQGGRTIFWRGRHIVSMGLSRFQTAGRP